LNTLDDSSRPDKLNLVELRAPFGSDLHQHVRIVQGYDLESDLRGNNLIDQAVCARPDQNGEYGCHAKQLDLFHHAAVLPLPRRTLVQA